MDNHDDILDPTTELNMALVLMDKIGYDARAECRESNWEECKTKSGYSECRISKWLIVVPVIGNQNGNVVAARAKKNGNGNNANQIRCYNCQGVGHYARNYTARPRQRDVAYLQTQPLIAQKEEAWIQLQDKEFDLMAIVADCEEIEEVNANCILMANLQQASTLCTHADKAPFYDSDGSAEVHQYENCYNNKIFNMFSQEEHSTELLESTIEIYLVQHDDSNVIPTDSSMDPSGGDYEQHPATIEVTRTFYESLYNNLVIDAKKINTVNRDTGEGNEKLTAELARYKGQEKRFEFN
ncbi:hypothetical protein Tco_0114960 [Tanacetum coccineum]